MKTESKQAVAGAVAGSEKWLRMYRGMQMIRLFEEQVNELYTRAVMPGLAHLYIGEEAVAVGICEALHRDDYITSTHRGHGHCLAKGADPASGNLGANAIVGGSAGIATGAAFSAKHRGTKQVAVCFFGEGALGQGLLYEVMNLASLWNLPVIYVCENNMYNEYTHFSETTSGEILARPAAFGIPGESVDGQDIRAVNEAASRMVERARAGDGPSFLLCNTYRYHGHHVGDVSRDYYRAKQEELQWRAERDPIKVMTDWLLREKIATQAQLEEIQAQAKSEIDAAVAFALQAPYPNIDKVGEDVYA
jgi:acetoin:2,6-dichlorophenolindophenol oxidoreductase subunit alpha